MAAIGLAAENPQIAVDADAEQEAFGDDVASDTTSLKSYALKYDYLHGRRYQNVQEGGYLLPNDQEEQDRLDLDHHTWKLMLEGKQYLAPVKDPKSVLDLGTGTGLWAIEVADELADARIIGTDLSPVQASFVPPKLGFLVDNFENDWTWDHNSFDLVHSRVLCGSVVDYTKLLKQAFDSIKPGGYIEMQDMLPAMSCDDDSCGKDDPIMTMGQYAAQAIRKSGRTLLELDEYKKHLEDAGFVNVKEVWLKRALNTWPKDPKMKQIGVYTLCQILSGIYGFIVYMYVHILGWKQEDVEKYCEQIRKDARNTKFHAYQQCLVIYGQKPEI